MVEIREIKQNKKDYMELLLLADESEIMVDKYLERGDMFVLDENGVKAECVVTREEDKTYELKNIAVEQNSWRKGYGRALIEFVKRHYEDCHTLFVGTGDAYSTMTFYQSCGFKESHRVQNFFIDNYDHFMYEDGVMLVDMVYLMWVREV